MNKMPQDLFLDGEFWFGRESFQEASKISSRKISSQIDWSGFRYMVFDVPLDKGTYQERYAKLGTSTIITILISPNNLFIFYYTVEQIDSEDHPFIKVAPRTICAGVQHLQEFFQDVIDKGGEGLILRDPTSPYVPGRSPGYLKHKVTSPYL